MKVAVYKEVGGKNIPQEVRRLRRETFDFHRRLGTAVVFKHAWTEEDVEAGRAEHCPYCRDAAYKQGVDWDPHCFGTGYLGGFDDGVVTFMTFGDATEDIFKITEYGLLMRDKHPICTAPWIPKMADGDLIIKATFDVDTWDVIGTSERYTLKQVTPVEPRGAGGPLTAPPRSRGYRERRQNIAHLVGQNFQVDHLPFGHRFYNVPVEFDSSSLPEVPVPAPGVDPDSYDTLPQTLSAAWIFVIHGGGEDVIVQFPHEEGMTAVLSTTRGLRITGTV